MRAQATSDGEVIELSRDQLLSLVQTDSDIGELLMRAFIFRRLELIAHGIGDVVLIGSVHSPDTLRVREFLTRNGHPFAYIDLDRDADVQTLLDRFHVAASEVPVLICRGDVVLRNPTNHKIAGCLGFNEAIDQSKVRDLVVVGAGAVGTGRCRLRRVRRAGRPRPRVECARRPGRVELENRKLPWLPDRDIRAGTCSAGAYTRRRNSAPSW